MPGPNKIIAFVLLFVSFPPGIKAQKDDAPGLIQEYLKISRSYQRLPLQAEVNYKQYANAPLFQQDTLIVKGQFFLRKDGAYIKFGQMEQIINDTIALVVMNDIKHMILSDNNTPIESYIQAKVTQPVNNINTGEFSKRYKITKHNINDNIDEIEITNRNNLFSTEEASEVIHFQYNVKEKNPEKIVTIKRSLVSTAQMELTDSIAIPQTGALTVKKIEIPGKGIFFIKEQISVFEFSKIAHDENLPLPVLLSDRLTKDSLGKLQAITPYASYYISRN